MFEKLKSNLNIHKKDSAFKEKQRYAENLTRENDSTVEISKNERIVDNKIESEEWFKKQLGQRELEQQVFKAKKLLYIQRDKLLRRILNFNRERKYIMTKPNTAIKKRELMRCSNGAKNAAFALSAVEDALGRLEDIRSEYEWQGIMSDLTSSYKTINSIVTGSNTLNKLAFLVQRTKFHMNEEVSLLSMEHHYGQSVAELLETPLENIEMVDYEKQVNELKNSMDQQSLNSYNANSDRAIDNLVDDSIFGMEDSEEILEAIRWGSIYKIQPVEFSNIVEETNEELKRTGSKVEVENYEVGKNVNDVSGVTDFYNAVDDNYRLQPDNI